METIKKEMYEDDLVVGKSHRNRRNWVLKEMENHLLVTTTLEGTNDLSLEGNKRRNSG